MRKYAFTCEKKTQVKIIYKLSTILLHTFGVFYESHMTTMFTPKLVRHVSVFFNAAFNIISAI